LFVVCASSDILAADMMTENKHYSALQQKQKHTHTFVYNTEALFSMYYV